MKALDGIGDVNVDPDSKNVRVNHDEGRLEKQDIATVIEAVSYEVAAS